MVEQMLKSNLVLYNLDILKGSNGLDGVQRVQETLVDKTETQFDLIILDLEMPIMNGFLACKNINDLYEQYVKVKKGKKMPLLKSLRSRKSRR